jgi:hypothetical protein
MFGILIGGSLSATGLLKTLAVDFQCEWRAIQGPDSHLLQKKTRGQGLFTLLRHPSLVSGLQLNPVAPAILPFSKGGFAC